MTEAQAIKVLCDAGKISLEKGGIFHFENIRAITAAISLLEARKEMKFPNNVMDKEMPSKSNEELEKNREATEKEKS